MIQHLNESWKKSRNCQINRVHKLHKPLTDLMDLEFNRDANEFLLGVLQNSMSLGANIDRSVSPYALRCLQLAYRKNREDNLFAKNASIPLSRFLLRYESIEAEGILLYNINADNHVGTLVFTQNFNALNVMDMIEKKKQI